MKWITTNDLRLMRGSEGFIIQGCAKNLQLWVDMVNRMLANENLLLEGTYFKEYYVNISSMKEDYEKNYEEGPVLS